MCSSDLVEYCMRKVMAERMADDRARAAEAMRERVQRAERQAEAEERGDNRFWMLVNAGLLAGVALIGLLAWILVKNAG